jgi:hypothetical protein
MENKILVIYIGVQGIRSEDIGDYTHKVANKIIPSTFEGEVIIIPTESMDTRIECINPKYITDIDLVNTHNELMKKLNSELKSQIEILKNNKNEQN